MKLYCRIAFFMALATSSLPVTAQRWIGPNDVLRVNNIGAPKISPEGKWILYSHGTVDAAKDKNQSKLCMVSTDGTETLTLTEQTKSFSSANWSPDGKYISFMAAGKDDKEGSQLYLLDRRGGEARQQTHIKGEISSYQWFPDGKRILFAIRDFNYADTAKTNIRKPYEIDRYQFKQDYEGYLDNRKTHLYIWHVADKKLDTLTRGKFDERDADISADGSRIVYSSNISADPDKNENTDLFIVAARAGAVPEQLTDFKGGDRTPRFSPDGKKIAYIRNASDMAFEMYDLKLLMLLDLETKKTTSLSAGLDRSVEGVTWSRQGDAVISAVEDDRYQLFYRFGLGGNDAKPITPADGLYSALHMNEKGDRVSLYSNPHRPNEICLWKNDRFEPITRLQDSFLAPLKKMHVRGITATSVDKNVVNGILYTTDSAAVKQPLVLFIHGGPVAQDEFGFDLYRQILAAAGYTVVAVNYRGSSGRGAAYTKSIFADWGNKEVKDILAITESLIKAGLVDSNRMAIAGWSYGGILTNYTIATDKRFKAAVSGAGSSLTLSFYGSDQYITQYENELGKPWDNPKKWLDLSYPFFQVKKIKTPTLFMASQADFNVPVIGAEQMYQAFKSEGIPTQLIIYPNQHHGISVPSYIIHRFNAHINWFKKYMP
ncbi:MAG: S9 family peptidase [Bacteroidota bacterium]|jgi:dipeptidyl aminopeptidase/acylaminoacyl peptidase